MNLQEAGRKYIASLSREDRLIRFFGVLFFTIVIRLFYLQIVQGGYYEEVLASQHLTASSLEAQRGQIFITDKAGTQLQMTENVEYFTLFIDPKFIENEEQRQGIVDVLTPITYDHLCVDYGIEEPTKETCINNLESFIGDPLLPEKNSFYTYSGDNLIFIDNEEYEAGVNEILEELTKERIEVIIRDKYRETIKTGLRERNYLGAINDEKLLSVLTNPPYNSYIDIFSNEFVYIKPANIQQPDARISELKKLFKQYEVDISEDQIKASLRQQEVRYIRLLTNMNAKIAKRIKDAKSETYDQKYNGIPLLHGLGLETFQERYYPHGKFMAHLLGYVDKNDNSYYGIEEFYDSELRGSDGKIIGLATPWIGQIGANNFDIKQPKDGVDVYLTIDPVIQKELESTVEYYLGALRADSIAVTILDPFTGKVKAMANAPTFDPNNYEKSYQLRPLSYNERIVIDDLTYIDYPVFSLSGDSMIQTSVDDRNAPGSKKYIFENYLGPQVFVNKNISFPYEPGSVLKAITLGVGIDGDAINLYDFYDDPEGFVKIGPYTIANIDYRCKGTNTFMHALGFSCNVGMVRIAQATTKYIFYSYLEKLGFGRKTTIELANEEGGTLPDFNTVSKARYFNNTYGQGFLATPLQLAVGYSSLINGGNHIEPTIVEALYDPNTKEYVPVKKKNKTRVFKDETSELMKEALVGVITSGGLTKYRKEGISIGGKTGTSEIAFKGKYQGGAGRTNGSFVGLVTAEDPRYVIAIQVRRPRTSERGSDTAGRMFSQIADFLLSYDTIDR